MAKARYSTDLVLFADEKPFQRYVGVNGTGNYFTTTISYLLLYFTGLHWPPKSEKCSSSEVGWIVPY